MGFEFGAELAWLEWGKNNPNVYVVSILDRLTRELRNALNSFLVETL